MYFTWLFGCVQRSNAAKAQEQHGGETSQLYVSPQFHDTPFYDNGEGDIVGSEPPLKEPFRSGTVRNIDLMVEESNDEKILAPGGTWIRKFRYVLHHRTKALLEFASLQEARGYMFRDHPVTAYLAVESSFGKSPTRTQRKWVNMSTWLPLCLE